MGWRARPHEDNRTDIRRVGCLHLEAAAIREGRRCHAGDGRPRGQAAIGIEQIRRGIDFDVRFVGASRRIAAGNRHGRIRQQ